MDEIDGRPHAGQADMNQADMGQADPGQDAAHAVPCGCVRALRAGPEAALSCVCVRGDRDRQSASEVRSAQTEHATGAGVGVRDSLCAERAGESS